MIEVYEEWSDRDRRKSSSRQAVSAPDVSSMRRGIKALSEQGSRKASSSHVSPRNDKEEVNLDDPYPYDEPTHQYSSRKVTSSVVPVLKVAPAPPTPDFQPPPTPDFQPPPTPDFQPPSSSPQVSKVHKR